MSDEFLDQAGRSQLHYAALEGDEIEARQLIREGFDINLKDDNGFTPLHFAAQERKTAIALILLDAGAQIDPLDKNGNTPLINAVFRYINQNDGEIIVFLRKRGANPYLKNDYGQSPIELARMIANRDVSKFFIDLPD